MVDPQAIAPSIRVVGFSPDEYQEKKSIDIGQIPAFREKWPVIWVDVVGLGDAETIAALGELFDLHPLALEDVAHPHERAKAEEYPDYLFIIARMAHQKDAAVAIEQFSMFMGPGWVLTFQERRGDCLGPVRERIRYGRGRIRRSEADYLAYALLDALTDAFFPILDEFASLMDRLEATIIAGDGGEEMLESLYETKRSLVPIRRAIAPLRDVVKFLEIESGDLITDGTRVYLRDVNDHVSIILEQLDFLRELSGSLMDVHYSVVSHRMNEVMKVLTMIATIFMPLGFIAGLYGMNFDTSSPYNMPELGWEFGYAYALGLMSAFVVGMVFYFRRKGWF